MKSKMKGSMPMKPMMSAKEMDKQMSGKKAKKGKK
jgi:hypothetical protein